MAETNIISSDELDAVNDMLAAIGESPVNTLDGEPNADVDNARRILNRINLSVQAHGWTFNTDDQATLTPDVYSGLIPWLPGYIRLMATNGVSNYVRRGGFVYDRVARTDRFTGPITVQLVSLQPYDEMPVPFREYIVARAARQFQIQFFGAPELEGSLQEREIDAWRAVMEWELDYGAHNMLDGDAFVGGLIQR